MDLHFYWRIFLRRVFWVILLTAAGTAAGLYFAATLPAVFQANARLIVESEQIPDELAASTVQTAATEQIQIIEQRILTREVLLEMANRLNIYAGQPQMPASDKVDDLRSRISIDLQGGGRRGVNNATLVNVSFRAPDAQQAALVTNELVTLILRENITMRTTVSGQTLEFFVQEVDRLGQEMSRLSARILAFKEENLDALPDSMDFRRAQQAAVQERMVQIERTVETLTERRERLVQLFADTGQLPEATQRQASVEEQQLATLRREYSSAIVVLSTDNPRIAVLRARIDALEAEVAEQQKARLAETDAGAGAAADAGQAPPSQLDIQLADIDGQLSALDRQRGELENRMIELTETINATPGNAITLEALERDYDNLRTQYNQAVASKARAETGDMIEALSKGQRISLVEQAIAPKEPVSPNRPVLATMGVGGGLAVGLGLVALLELMNRAVRRPSEISARLGISALATVPYIQTRRQVRTRRMVRVAAVLTMLVVLAGGLWVIDSRVMPLDRAVQRLLGAALPAHPVQPSPTQLS